MGELDRWALLAVLILAGCSKPGPKIPPPEILCAAEALHLAREAGSLGNEDVLRAKSDLFRRKLPPVELERYRRQVDQLADRRGAEPIVPAATCEALLSAEDRRKLAASA